jgi:hypothetical protein
VDHGKLGAGVCGGGRGSDVRFFSNICCTLLCTFRDVDDAWSTVGFWR